MYEQLILNGIKGLTPEALAEITDFIYFIRKRTLHPQAFEEEMHCVLLQKNLTRLKQDEEELLEQKFQGYARCYPFE